MKWSQEYATGIERVDEQHKMIFTMAEDFRAALDEGQGGRVYGLLLDSLDQYCRAHFGFEEGCMARYHCPIAETNKEAHLKFVEVLSGFRESYAVSGFDRVHAVKLVDTVDRWLNEHICRIDVHLRESVRDA